MFLTDLTMGPVELARAVEERGLHSLYVPEHTHIPTSRRTPPPTGEAELRDEYKRTLDPFVALAMAAGATERLVVGTGICLVAQRDPIVTAKSSAIPRRCGSCRSAPSPTRRSWSTTSRSASPRSCCDSPEATPTACCRSSTSTRRSCMPDALKAVPEAWERALAIVAHPDDLEY